MSTQQHDIPEYGWKDANPTGAHSYLLPTVERAINDYLKNHSLLPSSLQLFDAGCGNGFLASYFSQRGFTVAGCDASEQGIAQSRRACPTGQFEVISVYENLAGRFGNEWDIVISSEVIEHLYHPRQFVKNVATLLKPGGLLVVTTPYHGYLKNLALAVAGAMDKHFTVLWDGGHIKFWSSQTLQRLLQEAHFGEYRFYGAGRLPYLWKSMVVSAQKPK